LVRRIIETLKEMQERVTFHWIVAHSGVSGNEEADRLAKEATGWRRDGGSESPHLSGKTHHIKVGEEQGKETVGTAATCGRCYFD